MEFWKRFAANRGGVIGLVLLVLIVAVAVAAPMLFPGNPWKMVSRPFLPPFENAKFLLGTDTVSTTDGIGAFTGFRDFDRRGLFVGHGSS